MKKRKFKKAICYMALCTMLGLSTSKDINIKKNLPENDKYENTDETVKVSIDKINKCKKMNLTICSNNSFDFDFLNECKNIEELNLYIECTDEEWKEVKENLRETVDFKKLDKLTNINITTDKFYSASLNVNNENFGFLHDAPNVNQLHIEAEYIDRTFIEDFSNLETLVLKPYHSNIKVDYNNKKLKNFFLLCEPLNAAIFMTNKDLNYFDENNINFMFIESTNNDNEFISRTSDLQKFKDANDKLDEIIISLGITDSDSYTEKIKKISMYILQELHYDTDVRNFLIQNNGTGYNTKNTIFYNDGYLTGSLYNNGSAICGNYAALFQALANRVGVESYMMISSNHAWNLVDVNNNDNYFYYDLTNLDDDMNLAYYDLREFGFDGIEDYFGYFSQCVPTEDLTYLYFAYNFPESVTQYSDFVEKQDLYKKENIPNNSKSYAAIVKETYSDKQSSKYYYNIYLDNKNVVVYNRKLDFLFENRYFLASIFSLYLLLSMISTSINEKNNKKRTKTLKK